MPELECDVAHGRPMANAYWMEIEARKKRFELRFIKPHFKIRQPTTFILLDHDDSEKTAPYGYRNTSDVRQSYATSASAHSPVQTNQKTLA